MAALRVFSRFYPEIIGGAGLLGFLLPGFFGGLRSGHIDDDFRDFVAGLGNTAEEEVANISHDSGAARRGETRSWETRMRRRESTSSTSPAVSNFFSSPTRAVLRSASSRTRRSRKWWAQRPA